MKRLIAILIGIFIPIVLFAANSENYGIFSYVFNSAGNTTTANSTALPGVTSMTMQSNLGEAFTAQARGNSYAAQAGLYNEFFVVPPTPTPSPTVTATPTITITTTPIRTFGGELLDKQYVYAAPHPMRGSVGHIYYHLAEPADVELKIFTSVTHRLVISKSWTNVPAGKNHWDWNFSNMANGVYLLLIKASNEHKTTKVIKNIAIIK